MKRLWTLWVAHYKRYRGILSADMVHVSRPSGRGLEVIVHVNASATPDEPRAMANLFNPTEATIKRTVELPLYLCGRRPWCLRRADLG